MLLPTACPACATVGPAPCEPCRALIREAPSFAPGTGLDSVAALMRYEGPAREVVARLKYRNARSALAWLADGMAGLVDPAVVDVVSWVPTTPSRRRQRGFDQGRLLASAVARRIGRPCLPLFFRTEGPPQTGMTRAQRLCGPQLTLRRRRFPPRVLLIDDVVTTGATLVAAATALRDAGAVEIHAVAAAHRP